MRAPQHQRLKVLPPHRQVIPAPYFIFLCTASSKAITQLSSGQHGHQGFPEWWVMGDEHPIQPLKSL